MTAKALALALIGAMGFPVAASAQTKYILISDIPRAKREAITLSRTDAKHTDCRISYVAGAPALVTYVAQDKMKTLLDTEKSQSSDRYILYSVVIDTAGSVASRVIETTMKQDQADRISALINSTIVARRDSAEVTFRLRLDPGVTDEPMRVGPSVTCAPQWSNRIAVVRAFLPSVKDIFKPATDSLLSATVSMVVDEHGLPLRATIKTPSGNDAYDKAVMDSMVKFAKFGPGTTDGKPAQMVVEVPVWVGTHPHVGH